MTVVDDYLATLDGPRLELLRHLVEVIRAELPGADEVTSYRLPAFQVGKVVCGFAATSAGASFYPFSGTAVSAFADRLAGYSTTKGAIHMTVEKPLPDDLVRDIIAFRLAEIDDRGR